MIVISNRSNTRNYISIFTPLHLYEVLYNFPKFSALFSYRSYRKIFSTKYTSLKLFTAKRKFLELTSSNDVENFRKKFPGAKNSFRNVSLDWLEFRKGNLNECTLKNYAGYHRFV